MKKLMTCLTALSMLAASIGCGGSASPEDPTQTPEASDQTFEEAGSAEDPDMSDEERGEGEGEEPVE